MKLHVLRRRLAALIAVALPSAAAGATGDDASTAGPYASARDCSACHQAIYGYWSESAHALAASRPSYLDALNEAQRGAEDAKGVRRGCVWCHAPTALLTNDYGLEQAVTREGVACDFCHTVAAVELGKPDHPFDLKPGKVKRGPLEYAETPSHATAYSTLHKASPLLCAACHEHRNALGVPVLSTYSEWREAPESARGVTCQECHMPLVPGSSAGEGLQSTQRRINLHRAQGGSAESQLRRGLELRIDSLSLSGSVADVQVVVTNAAVGHAAPGGLATKSLVLAVGVETTSSGELLHRRERVYRRELRDAQGRVLATVPELFLRAASLGSDTRLQPREARTERFTVPLPGDWKAIVARLEYRDASDPRSAPKQLLVAEQRRERGR
jgi:hypothetical protein